MMIYQKYGGTAPINTQHQIFSSETPMPKIDEVSSSRAGSIKNLIGQSSLLETKEPTVKTTGLVVNKAAPESNKEFSIQKHLTGDNLVLFGVFVVAGFMLYLVIKGMSGGTTPVLPSSVPSTETTTIVTAAPKPTPQPSPVDKALLDLNEAKPTIKRHTPIPYDLYEAVDPMTERGGLRNSPSIRSTTPIISNTPIHEITIQPATVLREEPTTPFYDETRLSPRPRSPLKTAIVLQDTKTLARSIESAASVDSVGSVELQQPVYGINIVGTPHVDTILDQAGPSQPTQTNVSAFQPIHKPKPQAPSPNTVEGLRFS